MKYLFVAVVLLFPLVSYWYCVGLVWLFTTPDYGKMMDDELKAGIRPPDPSRHSEYYE